MIRQKIGQIIRLERFVLDEKKDMAKLVGTMAEFEYSGMLAKYTLDVNGETVRIVEKNDGRKFFEKGQKMSFFVHPKDIMQY